MYSYDGLYKLLRERGIKKSDLTDKVGISSRTLAKIGKGEKLSRGVLSRLCDFFGCETEDICLEISANSILGNKLGISNSAELAREEERISKMRAAELFETDYLSTLPAGTPDTLCKIHAYLFSDIYGFAGKVRTVNIAKGNFRFAPLMYLDAALHNIEKMPQGGFDEIIEKYVEMNVAHPFREGNGRAARIWLDHILKSEIGMVVDWSLVDKEDYLLAMERSPIKDIEIKHLLRGALTDKINDREVFMKGIDTSYHYEGYTTYKTEDLK